MLLEVQSSAFLKGAAPQERVVAALCRPQVLEEGKHQVWRAAARAVAALAGRHRRRIVAQQRAQRPVRLPAAAYTGSSTRVLGCPIGLTSSTGTVET